MLTLIAAGILIVALPDSGKRIFSISRDHGPTLQDAMGLVLVLIGYTWFLIRAWKQRGRILQYKNRLSFKLIAPLMIVGITLIIVSVINDYGYWWVCGAVILTVLQSIIFFIALVE